MSKPIEIDLLPTDQQKAQARADRNRQFVSFFVLLLIVALSFFCSLLIIALVYPISR